jgi:hypothetical protein
MTVIERLPAARDDQEYHPLFIKWPGAARAAGRGLKWASCYSDRPAASRASARSLNTLTRDSFPPSSS